MKTYFEAINEATPTRPWRGIFVNGPEPEQCDRTGEEIPRWSVYIGDEDAEPQAKVYWVGSHSGAKALAARMARDRKLEVIDESMAA